MKVCFYQSYSSNNQRLYDLTVGNHLKYCAVNNYSSLFDNGPYTPFINCLLIKSLLEEYDFVFTAGADCIFTEATPIESFLDKDHGAGIQEEGVGGSFVNGEVNLYRASDDCMVFLDNLYIEQEKNPNILNGTQGLLSAVLQNPPEWAKTVQVLPPGAIQKFLKTGSKFPFERQLWTPGTLIAHACGCRTRKTINEDKYAVCKQFLESSNVHI